ncbi:acyl-CoA thioester hydrolase [Thiogranum longum]|uniref:Acyl-CoA thioester hydrolase n=1 Tax=Thiogranum longum TaxID=1537524 RepID=A0A4R1HCL2_9GAMM|nr:thioesterase family protein [Thiogranum longum]TCK16959.1 acyl-CoA thioester hydrolase [Thiogranum longum]
MNRNAERAIYVQSLPGSAKRLHRAQYVMRWGDMDAFGHLNNAKYFTYFEQARVDWLVSLETTHDLVLANVSCTFVRPLKFPALIEVELYGANPGNSSMDSFYCLQDTNENSTIYAIGHGTIVWYDHKKGCPIPIPSVVRKALND